MTLADFRPETIRGVRGFIRVGQTRAGQWWFIDADDRPFFSCGVGCVNRSGREGGRAAQPGPYTAAVNGIYGTEDPQKFVASVLRRLRDWRVNTLGAWSTAEFFDRGIYFTELMDFRKIAPESTIRLGGISLPDVFDPKWGAACVQWAAAICQPRRASRELVGYFTDHELGWPAAAPRTARSSVPAQPTLLQACLSLEPRFSAYHAAWEFLHAAHAGGLEAIARAWEMELPNKEVIRQLTAAETPIATEGHRSDDERFTREFARRYFTTVAAAVRQHDGNHLILGCRFARLPAEGVVAECLHPQVDVVSVDQGREPLLERLDKYARATPVLVSQFSWTEENAARPPAGAEPRGLTTIERMLARGRTGLRRLAAHPAVVGYAWPRWADDAEDEPPFGRGLVHLDDREARENTELLTDFNHRAARLRLAAASRPPER